jgi:hypothetical protein
MTEFKVLLLSAGNLKKLKGQNATNAAEFCPLRAPVPQNIIISPYRQHSEGDMHDIMAI